MSESPLIFAKDVVKKKNDDCIGVVIKVFADEEDCDISAKDQIIVRWNGLKVSEKVENEYDVFVVDRRFFPGDCVVSAANPLGQKGIILGLHKSFDLKGHDCLIENMTCHEIKRIKEFEEADHVIFGDWIGIVDKVLENVTLKLKDGSACRVLLAHPWLLKPLIKPFDKMDAYYPGQWVEVKPSSINSEVIQWITKPTQGDIIEGQVTKVDVGQVEISWFASTYAEDVVKPDAEQSPDNLRHFSCFPETDWEFGRACFLSNESGIYFIENVRTKVDVSWQDGSITQNLDSTLLILKSIDSGDYFPGQFVLKATYGDECKTVGGVVKTVDSKACVSWFEAFDKFESDKHEIVSIYELKHDEKNDYNIGANVIGFSRFGTIIGINNGVIRVSWDDGSTTEVGPREIKLVEYYSVEESFLESKLVSETEVDPREATYYSDEESFADSKLLSETEFQFSEKFKALQIFNDEGCRILTFDFAEDPSDHKFACITTQNIGKRWLQRANQDWKTLRTSLPKGIFVRVYEDRAYLWRSAIVGALGTPYENGLYLFDFYLSPMYPDAPPLVYFHSRGLKLNPNLYVDGKVCLSLLNTWNGGEKEMWNPTDSTMLQLLISLQSLVLNSKPYFNEAGYDKLVGTSEGERNSILYNELAFLASCKLMVSVMKNPLKDFEHIVLEHFKSRGKYILRACAGYLDNTTSSDGFKDSLRRVAGTLFTALKGIGAECEEFECLV